MGGARVILQLPHACLWVLGCCGEPPCASGHSAWLTPATVLYRHGFREIPHRSVSG